MESFHDFQPAARTDSGPPIPVDVTATREVENCDALDSGPRTRLNRRLLWVSVAVALGVFIGLPMLHARQMRQLSSMLYKRAQTQQATGNVQATIAAWSQYLAFNPDDYRALASLSDSMAKVARTPTENFELFRLYERVLQGDPENADCRRKVIDLLMRGSMPSAARSHIDILLAAEPKNSSLYRDRAVCWLEEAELERAAADFLTASKLAPKDYRLHRQLVSLLTDRLNRTAEAERFMNEILEENGFSSEAYLARAEFFDSIGKGDKAAQDVEIAYQLAPYSPVAQLAMARLAARQGAAARLSYEVDLDRLRRDLSTELQRLKFGAQPSQGSITVAELAEAVALLDVHQNRIVAARAAVEEGLLDDPTNVNLLTLVAELHLAGDDASAANAELEKLGASKAPRPVLRFLEARVAMMRKEWPVAIRELVLLSETTNGTPYLESQIQRLLGDCYVQIGDQSAALIAYRRAAAADPSSIETAQRLAEFLASQGQFGLALEEYDRFAGLPGIDLQRARLMLRMNLARAETERDWGPINEILEAEARHSPEDVAIPLLRAEVLEACGDAAGAEATLRETRVRHAASPAAQVALAEWLLRKEHPEEALAILIDARKKLGNDRQLVQSLVRALHSLPTEQRISELMALWTEFLPLAGGDATQVRRVIAEAILQVADRASCKRVLDDIRRDHPEDIELWVLISEWSLWQGDREQALAAIAELHRLEGEEGTNWRLCEVELCVFDSQRGQPGQLRRAAKLLDEASAKLTGSARLSLAQAEVAALSGNVPSAIRFYRHAIELGERRPAILRRVVRLLLAADQAAEASRILDQFRRDAGGRAASEFRDLDVLIALRTQPVERALERAAANAAGTSAGAGDVLMLGQVQAGAGKLVEAEASFRKVIELEPDQPAGWLGLVIVLASQQRTAEAEEVLNSAGEQIAEDQQLDALATGYEVIGQSDRAAALYSKAMGDRPGEVQLAWRLAGVYLRSGAFQEAEPILQQVVEQTPQQQPGLEMSARRLLAAMMHRRSDYESYLRGLTLIDENLAMGGEPNDLRLKSRFLAAHPSEAKRREAIELLMEVERRVAALDSDDLRQMVELYLSVGDWKRARERLVLLIAAEMNTPEVLAYGCGLLLKHNEPPGHWLDVLRHAEPDAPRTTQLVAWDLARQGQIEQSVELILTKSKTGTEEAASGEAARDLASKWSARVCVELGRHFETAGSRAVADRFYHEAEVLYRGLAARHPGDRLALAELLGRQGRLDEALDECDRARSEAGVAPLGQTAVSILRNDRSPLSLQRHQRVRQWLETAIETTPDSAELAFQLATLTHRQGDYAAAIRYYRQSLAAQPGSLAVQNELSLLLALFGKEYVEALDLIDKALATSGPLPVLMDTRAVILVASGSPDAAIADLTVAIAEQPSAVKYFHLAQARLARGDRAGGAEAFLRARELGLTDSVLHPLEIGAYQRLSSELVSDGPTLPARRATGDLN